jgi:multidrug efflux pump subunit AcrA (membrane-fusion protein)
VSIGRDLGSWVEVTGGLAAGERIVINPADDLRDGTRVRIAAGDSTAAGAASPDSAARRHPQ